MERRVVDGIPVNLPVVQVVMDFFRMRGRDVVRHSPHRRRCGRLQVFLLRSSLAS
jgi:hypothetical protein